MVKKRGVGYGCMLYGVGFGFNRPDISAAYVEMGEDGSVTVLSGCAEIGQGSDTALSQIVAEELGLNFEDVRIISADTAITPDGGPSTASRQTYVSGNAVRKAASEVKNSLLRVASDLSGIPTEELYLARRAVWARGKPDPVLPVAEVANQCHRHGKPFMGFGWHDITTSDVDPETCQGDAYSTFIYATQAAEVEVDTQTGEVKVLRIVAAHDVGRAINPQMVEAQIEGACAQGMGYALYEEMIIREGRTLTPSLAEYLLPTSLDMPPVVPIIVEDPDPTGPFGAKGVGEGAIIPTAPAIVNAIYDAVGVRVSQLPVKPQEILRLPEERSTK